MVSLEDLRDLTLYKKQFFLPVDPRDKKRNSAILVMAPNYKSTQFTMTAPYTVNRRYFESYYLEKSITKYIQNESVYDTEDPGMYLFEEALSSSERNKLDDSDFGIPSQKKYPMPDEEHVISAIRFFNYVDKEHESELAHNIIKKIKEFDMADRIHVGDKNRFKSYWEKSGLAPKNESTIIEESSTEEEFTDYCNEFSVGTAVDYANNRFAGPSNIVFTGYKSDIDKVKKYFNKSTGSIPFDKLDIKAPNKINVIVVNDPNVDEWIDSDSVSIYTPNAFKRKSFEFKYEDYITFIMQLYAVCNLKPRVGKIIEQALAVPFAITLSGIADKIISEPADDKDKFNNERVFKYIIDEYGIDEAKRIIEFNNFSKFMQYAKEYYKQPVMESYFFDEAEGDVKADIPEIGELPESLKAIQNMGTKLKRKIRQQTVYKLNKLRRDIERGNVGNEERGKGLTTVQQLQTGDISGISRTNSTPIATEEQVKRWSDGDYILEGNFMYLFEDNINYDTQLRRALFKDRLRTNKEVLEVYKQVKKDLPFIKYTFTDLYRYNKRNVFVDLAFYNEAFFRNLSELINDDGNANSLKYFKIYAELMNRLITDDSLNSYNKKTIFIPVLDWRHNNSMRMWMYKQDINPISVIYYYILNDRASLKKLFGDKEVVFLGGKNYFKINFSKVDFGKGANVTKFITLLKRLITLGYDMPADPDPEGDFEDSPKGIAMDIIDRIERSQNVSIDNVSKIEDLKTSIDLLSHGEDPYDISGNTTAAVKNDISAVGSDVVKTVDAGKITTRVYDKSFTGRQTSVPVKVDVQKVTQSDALLSTKQASFDKAVNSTTEEDKKDAIVDAVVKAANTSDSVDTALDKLDDESFKQMISDLNNDSENNVRVDSTRASKVVAIEDEFHKKEVAGKSVKEMLTSDPAEQQLEKTDLKINSINEDWSHMTFMNFDKGYDPDADMIKMLDSMQHWTFPIAVKNLNITDNSTSEDVVNLWEIECVDYKNTKFTIRVDIPKFLNGSNFLKLRGNEKALMIQSVLIPIIKTGLGECQIIGSGGYGKTFVRRFGGRSGQSMPATSKLMRALNRYSGTDIKVIPGDNTKVCSKYELPIDYIDLAGSLDRIETSKFTFYFNQDELRTAYQIDDIKGIPVGIEKVLQKGNKKAVETVLYYSSKDKEFYPTIASFIGHRICSDSPKFDELYNSYITSGARYTYSQASILNVKIPVVVVCGYVEGLISTMKKGNVSYTFVQELDKSQKYSDRYDYIKFSDGYLVYEVNYSSSLLMNGLKENDTESYSIKDVNSRLMYLEFLENYGGTLKADGLENAYDCMLDPITKEILAMYKLPTDFVGVMLHANNLLADNKYVKHIDQTGRRWRRKEVIAGFFYKALSEAYRDYANSIRHNRKNSKLTMKQSAVIDSILSNNPSISDLSVNNVVNDVECANTVTNKGLVGMNEARAYSINTRGYDESMLNILGMDTGFSGNVGINRQATVDANIEGGRGLVKSINGDTDKMSIAKTMTITEAVTPFGSTHDDPPRTLMTYVQTSKHMVRCENNDPMLITTGADEALPYLASDIFSFKAKEDGKVVELVMDKKNPTQGVYMVVEYKSGAHDYIDLTENIRKNSDGGYSVPLQLSTDLQLGSRFKAGSILAYDKLSFSKSLGESGKLAANIGTLAKVAIINTDEGFEDSAAITESFAQKIGTAVVMSVDTIIDKGSNIFLYKNIGDDIMEGDTLMAYQKDFDDDVVNTLLKNLTMDQNQLSELGRNPIVSKYTGTLAGIEVYRTCELEEMSPSLRDFVVKYEKNINNTRSVYKKYGIDDSLLPQAKVEQVGKAKNVKDAVKIIFYIKYIDNMSVGDKIVFYSANKGIIKYIIPKEDEPFTDFRPTEHVDSFMSLSSISGRMTASIPLACATNKLMVELDRSVKDLAGIPYDDSIL